MQSPWGWRAACSKWLKLLSRVLDYWARLQGRMATKNHYYWLLVSIKESRRCSQKQRLKAWTRHVPICIPPNQSNPIKSISGARNPSSKETLVLFFPTKCAKIKTRAVAPNQGHQGHCSREPIPRIDNAEPRALTPQRSVPASHPAIPGKPRSREHISWSVHKMVGCDLTTPPPKKKHKQSTPVVAWKKRL